MNRTRRLNVLSLVLCFFIVASSVLGIVFSIIEYGFIESLRTFGFIMNSLIIVGCIYLFIHGCQTIYDGKDKTGKGIYLYTLVCAVSILTDAIFYFLLINSNREIMYRLTVSCVFFQIVTPILSMILVITTIIKYPFDFRDSFYSSVPSIIYGMSYFFMILSSGKTYDFYGLFEQGKMWLSAIYLLTFIMTSFIISVITVYVHDKITIFGSNSKLILRNGLMIPRVGFGTWSVKDEEAEKVVCDAVSVGYTHIDTSSSYGNEKGIGKGIKSCGLERKKLFITTKIPAEIKDYQKAIDSIENSMKELDLNYIDLVLISSPQDTSEYVPGKNFDKENVEVWKALEYMYLKGKVKAIGVSNFNVRDLENLFKNCHIPPMVNQICCYIGNTPLHLIKYCQKHKIVVEAYSTLDQGKIFNDARVKDMAMKYRLSIASLSVRYVIDLGCVSLPKSSTKDHMIENFDTDMRLKHDDVELMASFVAQEFADHKMWPTYNSREYYEID